MPLVEKRYAEALLKLSDDKDWLDKSLASLKFVTNIYVVNLDFKAFLISPQVKATDKKDVLKKLLTAKLETKFINFLLLLIDKGRIQNLPVILTEYVILVNKAKNILEIEIISAEKIGTEQVKKIEKKYKKLYKTDKIKSIVKIDKSLIGGLKILIGDKVYDNSIKTQLANLKQSLNSA